MKVILVAGFVLAGAVLAQAANSISPWVPIFQGVEQATGTNNGATIQLSVDAIRVDLHHPDIRLLVTPPVTNNYISDLRETLLQTPREFMREHGVQVAVNGSYFQPPGYFNPSGTPSSLAGAVISRGQTVSVQTSSNDSLSAVFFTTTNQASLAPVNWPPADTTGVFTALPGLYPILVDGENISYAYTNALFDSVHQRQPRTALGLSQDNRYLILITIDGRQALSDGAFDYETAEFLQLFGAWNGINLDGGGSTCMVKADECGTPVDINQNSFQFAPGQTVGTQRPVGCNFGIYAALLPRPIRNLHVQPGSTTALVSWQTDFPATTQVQYGPTTNYGSATPLDSRLVRTHVATLTGLAGGSNYFFRIESSDGATTHTLDCSLRTTTSVSRTLAIPMTGSWKYSTNNLDGVGWKTLNYNESGWEGPSPACLHIEASGFPFAPRNTLLPPGYVVPIFRTYYFRTPFVFTGSTAGVTLTFSNYIDDGAVFYLNGSELTRIRLPASPNVILNSTAAFTGVCSGTQYQGDAATTCPDVFTVSGSALVQGTNIVAVEVHNVSGGSTSQDIFFGSALFVNRPGNTVPELFIASEGGQSTLYWNGQGFTLQRSTNLSSPANWTDVPGPVTQSPAVVPENGSVFYRLRN